MNKLFSMPEHHPHPENQKNRFVILSLLLLSMSACNLVVAETPSEQVVYDGIETFVAETVTSMAVIPAVSTTTPSPTATMTFTATPSPTATITATPTSQIIYSYVYYTCGDSEFIKDVTIPDETVILPGEDFVKTWKFKNTGNCTWTSDFTIVFIAGDDMDGSDTEIDQKVYVDEKGEISVALTAPDDEGTYTGYWQLADLYGQTFGNIVDVKIVVKEATPTPTVTNTLTATPTPTYTPTATPTSTTTPTPTYTPMPTSTPETDTATPTYTPTPASTSETDTATPTYTPCPTSTPEDDDDTPTSTPVPTETPVETSTPITPTSS